MNHAQKVPQASRSHRFPAFLDIQGKKIVLIGGGANATRKARRLLEAGALVSTISEELSTEFKQLECLENVMHVPRTWSWDDLNNVALVVIATDDKQENTLISEAAHANGCWVNVANQPSASNFLIPSLIDRTPLLIAVYRPVGAPLNFISRVPTPAEFKACFNCEAVKSSPTAAIISTRSFVGLSSVLAAAQAALAATPPMRCVQATGLDA